MRTRALSLIGCGTAAILASLVFLVHARPQIELGGTWLGKFEPPGRSGNMELVLVREGAQWKAQAKFQIGPRESSNPIEDLKVDGNQVSFATSIGGTGLVGGVAVRTEHRRS